MHYYNFGSLYLFTHKSIKITDNQIIIVLQIDIILFYHTAIYLYLER